MMERLLRARITLVPTVTLFIDGGLSHSLLREAKTYAEAGGRVAFGTDIGYLTPYDRLKQEVPLPAEGGMTARQILASLTTASLFDSSANAGRIAPGAEADWSSWPTIPFSRSMHSTKCAYHSRRHDYLSSSGFLTTEAPQDQNLYSSIHLTTHER